MSFFIGSGSVRSGSVAVASVLSGSIHASSVISGNIAVGAVTSGAIESGSIGNVHVTSGGLTSGAVASGSVGTVHVSSGGLGSGAIGSGQIGHFHVASGAIASGQIDTTGTPDGTKFLRDDFTWSPITASILSGAVGSGDVASGAIQGFFGTTRNIASGTVGSFDLGSGAVVAGSVGSGAVVSGNIASGQIGTNHLGFGLSVTYNEPTADHLAGTQSIFDSVTLGETVVFADLLYLKSDGKWWLADADAAATMPGLRMALAGGAADAVINSLVQGRVRDDSWAWTVGGLIYASTTAGGLTQTAPSETADMIQIIGVAYHADKMLFGPSPVMAEVV